MKRHHGWIIAIALLGLVPAAHGQGGGKEVKIERNKDSYDFYVGDELVTSYRTTGFAKPIFWPVNAPGGIPLTRNYPPPEGQAKDHPHQKSAWFCHGDVIPEGIEFKSQDQKRRRRRFLVRSQGPRQNRVHRTVRYEPRMATPPRSTHERMAHRRRNENHRRRRVTISLLQDLGKAQVLLVVDIDLHASVCPITFGDTKEGWFGIRINDVINAKAQGQDSARAKSRTPTARSAKRSAGANGPPGAITPAPSTASSSAWRSSTIRRTHTPPAGMSAATA